MKMYPAKSSTTQENGSRRYPYIEIAIATFVVMAITASAIGVAFLQKSAETTEANVDKQRCKHITNPDALERCNYCEETQWNPVASICCPGDWKYDAYMNGCVSPFESEYSKGQRR